MAYLNTPMPTLETERLVIRRFALPDLADLHRLVYSDPDVSHFYSGGTNSLEETRENLIHTIWLNEHDVDQGWGSWAVIRKEDNQLIGRVNLGRPDRTYYRILDPKSPYFSLDTEIAYAFGKAYWGKGYAAEACKPVIEYAFKELRIKRIVTGADSQNTRAINLLKRLGFRMQKNFHPKWGGGDFEGILENNML